MALRLKNTIHLHAYHAADAIYAPTHWQRSRIPEPYRTRAAVAELDAHGWKTDYVAIRRQVDLQMPQSGDHELVVLAASRLGTPRLIDNLEIIANCA